MKEIMNNIKCSYKVTGYSLLDWAKFLVPSTIGLWLFLYPTTYKGNYNIPIGVLSNFIADAFGALLPYAVTIIIAITAFLSLLTKFLKPKAIVDNNFISKLFIVSNVELCFRILGLIFSICALFKVGPEAIYSEKTAGMMLDLAATLIIWFFAASYLIPLLTDFGAMEFIGNLLRVVVKPLFRLPGRSAVNIVTSWVGTAPVGVVITRNQYDNGYYTKREAANIMVNFSLVSIAFCLVIAAILGLENVFGQFYLTTLLVGIVVAFILVRIPPLSLKPDVYSAAGKQIDEIKPEGKNIIQWALDDALNAAKKAKFKDKVIDGNKTFISIIFGLAPLIVAYGTIALLLVEYTPVFKFLSYPFGYYLNIFGIENAFEVAPATIVGFVDMFIPASLIAGVESVKTKFVVGALSLIQIIYMTEVGALMIKSDVSLDFKDLVILFIMRTVIAIPLIVLCANILL